MPGPKTKLRYLRVGECIDPPKIKDPTLVDCRRVRSTGVLSRRDWTQRFVAKESSTPVCVLERSDAQKDNQRFINLINSIQCSGATWFREMSPGPSNGIASFNRSKEPLLIWAHLMAQESGIWPDCHPDLCNALLSAFQPFQTEFRFDFSLQTGISIQHSVGLVGKREPRSMAVCASDTNIVRRILYKVMTSQMPATGIRS